MLVDGVVAGVVDASDRGLAYGDGLFETIAFVAGRAPLWERHMARLAAGCTRLGLPAPDARLLADEAARVAAGELRSVVRICLTRGRGARGYAPPPRTVPTRIVAAHPAPVPDADGQRRGIRVRLCNLRLAAQPALAGLKHLNRLEQVLARDEWDDPAIGEGLLRDADGRLVSATAANLFLVRAGVLQTPALDRCGVAGVARAQVLAWHAGCQVREIEMGDLMLADEVFLTSSVRGVVPVTALDGRSWPVGPLTRTLQGHWRDLGLGLEVLA
ncbi:MAG: aminodeoxychorismate lyase [Dokdonella sp.]|nr:aminodeoxychorismate lyase [Dokdonella sp.]